MYMCFFARKNIIFDKITAILTLTFQTLVSSIDWMCWGSWVRMGQGVRTSLGHGGITCVLQTQFSSSQYFQHILLTKGVKLHVHLWNLVVPLVFSSILHIWYVEVRMSQSVSEGSLRLWDNESWLYLFFYQRYLLTEKLIVYIVILEIAWVHILGQVLLN